MSPDEETHIASQAYLSGDQIKEMNKAGISIGSHTNIHRILAELNEEEVKFEILGSKNKIEDILQRPALHFAYPFGDNGTFNAEAKETVKASGFLSACSRFEGINNHYSAPYALKRIGIGDCKLPTLALKSVLNELSLFLRRHKDEKVIKAVL